MVSRYPLYRILSDSLWREGFEGDTYHAICQEHLAEYKEVFTGNYYIYTPLNKERIREFRGEIVERCEICNCTNNALPTWVLDVFEIAQTYADLIYLKDDHFIQITVDKYFYTNLIKIIQARL